jgi:hypothetical protein
MSKITIMADQLEVKIKGESSQLEVKIRESSQLEVKIRESSQLEVKMERIRLK